ncbi:MAG: biotin/lipoate A/B protein ligase family protein [Woeseiaceae bacterium]
MSANFRIIDTGVREGRANIAFDAALIELRQADKVPDTIRFLRFPPTALLGRHQDLSREIDVDYCNKQGVGTVRRITGGGAIYLDEGQLGWEIVFHRSALGIAALPDLAREICNAVAAGLSTLGVDARFRPRNDIEVDGRKISGTGGFFDGDILIYQGTVLVDLNPEHMVSALTVPESKLRKRDLDSASMRVVTLKELLGDKLPDIPTIKQAIVDGLCEHFGISAQAGDISAAEESLAQQYFDEEIGSDEFVAEIDNPGSDAAVFAGSHTGPGGTVNAFVKLEGAPRSVLQRVLISGDFFVTPPRVVFDLEAHLQGCNLDDVDASLQSFFEQTEIDTLSVSPADFKAAIDNALQAAHG